jgi:sulfide:quinone oxidoreductase
MSMSLILDAAGRAGIGQQPPRLAGYPQPLSEVGLISASARAGTMSGMSSKVLIAGAGVAGLEGALALRELAGDLVDVELVSPETDFVYRPLAVAEPFRVGEARRFPLHHLVEAAGATLIRAAVRSVDPERRMVVTSNGAALRYDSLLLALGARPVAALPGALTFRGPGDEEAFAALLHDARAGQVDRLVFALPAGSSWPLPLYELALLTAVHLADAGASGVQLAVVTPEERPLQLFGAAASEAVNELLDLHGIELLADTTPVATENGSLRLLPDQRIDADRVVALPRLEGLRLAGLPHDTNGFVPTDRHGLVRGFYDVYAAGDLTDFPVKQGGIATQQADAAAESIAASAGAQIEPQPFRPVLRGLLLTGMTPRYLRGEPGSLESQTDTEPLWWPPAKIVGLHLAPFLASQLHLPDSPPPSLERLAVDVDLLARVP